MARLMAYGMVRGRAVSEPLKFQGDVMDGWTVAATALGDNQMSFTRRNLFWGWEQ